MTRVFDENGNHVPVTVLELINNFVVQEKNLEKDGYSSVKIGYSEKRKSLINAPISGELKKASIEQDLLPSKFLEFSTVENPVLGSTLSAENFTKGTIVKATGTSKGKGFAGVMKKYGFAGGQQLTDQSFTELQVQLVIEQLQEEFGKVRKCLAIWVVKQRQLRI